MFLTQLRKRIIIVTGHYGSGKTNLAVNLALDAKAAGRDTVLVDLDIVNPYFRSADFSALMAEKGIETISPACANTNLDIPALTGELDGAIHTKKTLIIDVGGDDAGAWALGRYSHAIQAAGGCDMLYVVSRYRYLTRTPEEAQGLLREIEQCGRIPATAVVNNSNLGEETTLETVLESMGYAQATADRLGLPLLFTAVERSMAQAAQKQIPDGCIYPVSIVVKKPWEVKEVQVNGEDDGQFKNL